MGSKTQDLIAIKITNDIVADSTIHSKRAHKPPKTIQKVFSDRSYGSAYRENEGFETKNAAHQINHELGRDKEAFELWKKHVHFQKKP